MGLAVVLLVFVVLVLPVQALGATRAEPAVAADSATGAKPVALGQSDGVIDVYWRSESEALLHEWYVPGAGWNGPQSLAGGVVEDPSPVIWDPGRYEVFYEGTDLNLHANVFNGASWSGGMSFGMGPLGGEPHAVSAQPAVIDVFWRGTDGGLWHAWSISPAVWYGPQELAPAGSLGSTSEPVPVTTGTGNGAMDVFWENDYGQLYDVTYRGTTGWSSPTELPEGQIGLVSSAVAYGNGDEMVGWSGAAGPLGTEGDLWYATDTGSVSRPANAGGAPLESSPELVSPATGQVDAFWRGADGQAWYESGAPGGSWSGAKPLPSGQVGSQPMPAASSPGVMDVFWRGGDGGLWHAWGSNNGGWAGPQELVAPGSCGTAACFGVLEGQ